MPAEAAGGPAGVGGGRLIANRWAGSSAIPPAGPPGRAEEGRRRIEIYSAWTREVHLRQLGEEVEPECGIDGRRVGLFRPGLHSLTDLEFGDHVVFRGSAAIRYREMTPGAGVARGAIQTVAGTGVGSANPRRHCGDDRANLFVSESPGLNTLKYRITAPVTRSAARMATFFGSAPVFYSSCRRIAAKLRIAAKS